MREALRRNTARAQTAQVRSIPAPYGGWDTDSPVTAMPKENAVVLDNAIPRGGYVELRRGFVEQCTGTAAAVETLIPYRGSAAGHKIFAATGAYLYDVTTRGSLPAASYSSAASARWNHIQFANDAGAWMIAMNGAQAPIKYNGTAFSVATITGTAGVITLDPTDLKYLMGHKNRIHMIEKETLRVWFLAANAVQGAAELLDLGPVFSDGGYLVGLCRLTLDGGQGIDDMAVYLTTEGQVAIYQGYDPSDAVNWSLVGVYKIPRPIGDRCLVEHGADVLVLTEGGLLSLTAALRSARDKQSEGAISRTINPTVAEGARLYGENFGWGVVSYPGRGGLLMINVPTAELDTSEQWVMSTPTRAWCRFTGIPAYCWGQANGEIYFGSEAGVYRWDVAASDNSEPIVADILPAFQAFGSGAQTKVFTMVRALLRAPAIIQPAMEVVTDYDMDTAPTAVQTVVAPGDVSEEDSRLIRNDWTGAAGSGYVASPRMRISVIGADDVAQVAVTSDLTELLLVGPGGTDNILTRPNLPLDVTVQCVGFDVMFQAGGQL